MRLINSQTLQLEEFIGNNIPAYAILSHTWGHEEVTFSDYTPSRMTADSGDGYKKIYFACQQASRDSISYVWVDTCCIDKSSSAELSESINSMYKWYQYADVCYAYLSDVSKARFDIEFPKSRWFSRGWTLQELIAPTLLKFYDQDWCVIGSRSEHAKLISDFTRIDMRALVRENQLGRALGRSSVDLGSFCVAKRMSWASNRETTRVEDMAYCLLGIFNVNMPLLYGEGERAFIRLQEEIIRAYNDDSILAWGFDTDIKHPNGLLPERILEYIYHKGAPSGLLAESPKYFQNCQNLEYNAYPTTSFTMTNLGLQIELPLVPVLAPDPRSADDCIGWVALLSCFAGTDIRLPGIVLLPAEERDQRPNLVHRIGWNLSARQTFLVGVRAASEATLAKITILRHVERRYDRRGFSLGYRHIIINESQAIRDVGYQISSVSAHNVGHIDDYKSFNISKWSPEENVFSTTTRDDDLIDDLICIRFKTSPGRNSHEFCVFIRNENVLVRDFSYATEAEMRTNYDLLEGIRQDHGKFNEVVIRRIDEGAIRWHCIVVSASIKKKVVVSCRFTYEVTVDVVSETRV